MYKLVLLCTLFTLFFLQETNAHIKPKLRVISNDLDVSFKELTGSYFIENQVRPTKKVKKWAIGPYLGAGIVTDINGSNPRLGWSAGISIHYDIWQLW